MEGNGDYFATLNISSQPNSYQLKLLKMMVQRLVFCENFRSNLFFLGNLLCCSFFFLFLIGCYTETYTLYPILIREGGSV